MARAKRLGKTERGIKKSLESSTGKKFTVQEFLNWLGKNDPMGSRPTSHFIKSNGDKVG